MSYTEFMQSKEPKKLNTIHLEIPKGVVAHNQSHSCETIIVVLEGAWRFCMAERVVTLKKDELLRIPAHESYSAEAIADTVALKIAHASRQDNQYVALLHEDPDQYLWGV